jgi:signal transduction histidine kinase
MIELNLIQILLITVGVTNFALGLLVLFSLNKKKDSSSAWFALVAFSVVLWTGAMIVYRGFNDFTNIVLYTKILYSSALLIPTIFLIFVNRFGSNQHIYKSEFLAFLFFVGLVILTFFTPYIINSVNIVQNSENQIIFGSLFFIYVLFLIVVFNLAFYNLIIEYKKNKGVKKKQILFIILGTTLSTYPAFFTNLLLPWIGIFVLNWFGQLSTIFLIIFTTYAIFKHHLFNIKMILSEILLGVMGIVLFIYIFLSRSLTETIVSIIFFIIFVILGYNLLKELLNGIKREKELDISNRKLAEAIESKDLFLRMTSHQLRTPLTSLNGFLSLILEQWQGKYKMNEYTKDDIVKVYINVQRLVELVNDILALSAIKAGRFGIVIRPNIDIKEELSYLIQDNKYMLEHFNTKVIMKSIGEDFIADVDSVRMKSVFQNLLSNAIYYGRDKIWVTLIDEGDRLRIRFRDNGNGIDVNIKDKIFNPGFRAGVYNEKNPNGSGFGLFISKEIITMHKGSLKLKDSGVDKGALFEIKLPKQPLIDKYNN